MRAKFPFKSGKFKNTKAPAGVPIEAIEARNVIHGLDLINHILETGNKVYPFGLDLSEEGINNAIRDAISEEVDRIIDLNDAVSDLGIAEGVHQVVQGNYDRGSAVLDAFGKGDKLPPIPDVVKTPRSGTNLTHRVGIQFESELGATLPLSTNPRKLVEPGINKWLETILPALDEVRFKVIDFPFNDPENQNEQELSLKDLGLDPIDLLYMLREDSEQAMTALDDRIIYTILNKDNLHPTREIKIEYINRVNEKIAVFELVPLIKSLRALILPCRPLKASDIRLSQEAKEEDDVIVHLEKPRLEQVKSKLEAIHNRLSLEVTGVLTPLLEVEDISLNQAAIISTIDSVINNYLEILHELSLYGFIQPSVADIREKKTSLYRKILKIVQEIVDRWTLKEEEYVAKLSEYDGLPPATVDEERFQLLLALEATINTTATIPLPVTPADLRNAILLHKTNFDTKFNEIKALSQSGTTELEAYLLELEGLLSGAPY